MQAWLGLVVVASDARVSRRRVGAELAGWGEIGVVANDPARRRWMSSELRSKMTLSSVA
jgi:hypothetical protein